MAYGTKTSNILDIPLSINSVVVKHLGDQGYSFEGMNTIRVLSVADGTLSNYNEADAVSPFGTPVLVAPAEQILVLNYNKSMLLRIQRTQIQDIPISQFSKKVALQQADHIFVPAHDAYSLAKIFAARPAANIVALDTTHYAMSFKNMIDVTRTNGSGGVGTIVAWVTYTFSRLLQDSINFTGSNLGYEAGKNGFIGKLAGVPVIEVPDAYFFAGVSAMSVEKSAVVNVIPKMDPKSGGLTVLEQVPGFSGIEIQLRDRSDTFVLNRHAVTVATLETAASTTTTTT